MPYFLSEDFLLDSAFFRRLYYDYAADQPIFDYHCHLPPEQIAENYRFKNLYDIWLKGDHYKWRAMRTNGISERFCTGDASDWEKFEAWAATVPHTIGNPLYHWTHLELRRPFGITDTPPVDFPAKLTRLLYARFCHFDGAPDKGWVLLPCELIDYNGVALKALVLRYAKQWQLPPAFIAWLNENNTFCSTLVDRIVTGYPRAEIDGLQQELGYTDTFLDAAEYFYLFVIQGPQWLAEELRLNKRDLNVRIVDDIKPYKERKVAILNGAHTALVPIAWLTGLDTVGEAMNDARIGKFVEKTIAEEIVPVLDLPHDELTSFAQCAGE